MNQDDPFLSLDVIPVSQRFGILYLTTISAENLLKVCFTDPLRYEGDKLKGNQRILDEEKRVKEIQQYVEGYDAAFPNSIIISANYTEEGLNCMDEDIRWTIRKNKLIIPTSKKLASVIDGQHRLFGFKNANSDAKKMELVCSVYLDLPPALQAFIFATINSNQKPVDRSLAYELFGFNIENEESTAWPPDKLAIALYHRFDTDESSPFFNHIRKAPQIDDELKKLLKSQKWLVSTATVVDGIVRLISSNPKKDTYTLQRVERTQRSRRLLHVDSAPLRRLYLNNDDIVIYQIVYNYFKAVELVFDEFDQNSAIFKTIGIQGLFDALRKILTIDLKEKDLEQINLKQERFVAMIAKAKKINFSDRFYQYSAVGRSNIAETVLLLNGYVETPVNNELISIEEAEKNQRKIKQHQTILELAGL